MFLSLVQVSLAKGGLLPCWVVAAKRLEEGREAFYFSDDKSRKQTNERSC